MSQCAICSFPNFTLLQPNAHTCGCSLAVTWFALLKQPILAKREYFRLTFSASAFCVLWTPFEKSTFGWLSNINYFCVGNNHQSNEVVEQNCIITWRMTFRFRPTLDNSQFQLVFDLSVRLSNAHLAIHPTVREKSEREKKQQHSTRWYRKCVLLLAQIHFMSLRAFYVLDVLKRVYILLLSQHNQ